MRQPSRDYALAALALLAAGAIGLGVTMLVRAQTGLAIERTVIGSTPATIYRPDGANTKSH